MIRIIRVGRVIKAIRIVKVGRVNKVIMIITCPGMPTKVTPKL